MIPERPLNFQGELVAIDDLLWIMEWMESPGAAPAELRRFLDIVARASDWSRQELGRANMLELGELMKRVAGEIANEQEAAVPPTTATSSTCGEPERAAASRGGRRSSGSRKAGDSRRGL